ncbi:MAG: hypothetical protein J6D09_05440 [Clostridia bacterium]|nr:hypothetical protein [Clostridia bacterium]
MLRKIFSVLLISLLIISAVPNSAIAAEASATAPGGTVTTPEELVSALGTDGVVYKNGVIKIIKDVVLSKSINITSGSYVIIGEGASIKGSFDGNMFVLSGEGTGLTLGDQIAEENKSDLVFDGDNAVRSGSVFRVEKGAKLEMCASVVIKNAMTSLSGAAVYNEGEFTMFGGVIENCRASSSGGAIYNAGTLTLASGNIENCSANDGGAVFNEGKATFVAVTVSKCNAPNGGALYNFGEMQYLSASITECSASTKGGAVYNSGKAVIKGGKINKNVCENGEGGGIYNTSELELSGSVLSENTAQNGGNVYNSGNAVTGEGFFLTSGVASEKGGNIYNSELGIFTQSTGVINLGKAVYGGGVYNVGTYNLGGGVYSNRAEVGEGVLNHGKLVLVDKGYVENGDDIFVVLTPENKHTVVVAESWTYNKKPVALSCGTYSDGSYEYSYSVGNKLLDIKGNINADKRFKLYANGTKLVISDNGTLVKATAPFSKTLATIVCIVFAYPLVTAVIVFTVRHFDKKKLA